MYQDTLNKDYNVDVKFKYVKSEENPCDLITRGLTYEEFLKQIDFWFCGPSWLPSYLEEWPESKLCCLSEKSKVKVQPSKVCTAMNMNLANPSNSIINVSSFSDLNKLCRTLDIVFRVVYKLVKKKDDPYLASKLYLLKEMQKESFSRELAYLQNPSKAESVPVLVSNLDLFLDNRGIIRSRGRIGKAQKLDYQVINPVLLAKDHHLTKLIVEFYHKRCMHLGLQTTLNSVRSNGFWIPRMRQSIKNILNVCFTCKKFNALALKYPKMTNLPKHRVNLVKPFLHTGVDFTGHLFVKNEKDENVKMYILIFTCLNVRAIHIELLPDMTTHSFVLAFLRFVNLYGVPAFLYSDNARSFVTGAKVLQQTLVCDEYKSYFQNYDIKHIRIPVYSAWVGASWERLIRTLKTCLYKTIGRARLSYFELLTVLSDVQAAINSRPLTYRSSENDLEVITPSSFLRFHSNPHLIFRDNDEGFLWESDAPSQQLLEQSLAYRDEVFAHFKEQWYKNYLLSLRERSRDMHQYNWQNRVKAGEVVLIKTPNKSRPYWSLGRVVELIIGHDDIVRSVKVKRSDGVIVHHSINHLYPLELSLTHAYNEPSVSNEDDNLFPEVNNSAELDNNAESIGTNQNSNEDREESVQNVDSAPAGRPQRKAATACKGKLRKWCAKLAH